MKTLDHARNAAAARLGFDLKGTKGSNLSQADYARLEAEMARVISAASSDYPSNVVDWASRILADPNAGQVARYGLGSAISDFVGEFGNQAVRINDTLNPLSEKATTARTITIGAILAGAVVILAIVASRARAALK